MRPGLKYLALLVTAIAALLAALPGAAGDQKDPLMSKIVENKTELERLRQEISSQENKIDSLDRQAAQVHIADQCQGGPYNIHQAQDSHAPPPGDFDRDDDVDQFDFGVLQACFTGQGSSATGSVGDSRVSSAVNCEIRPVANSTFDSLNCSFSSTSWYHLRASARS